jgi:hypothetical protein
MSPIQRIEQVLNEKGIKNPEFQKLVGIQSQHWNNWKIRGVPSKMIFSVATALGLNAEWIATGKGEKYSMQIKDHNAEYLFNLVERPPVIEETEWKKLPPQTRALFEDLLKKSGTGQLTKDHVKVLQSMVDVLNKD